ncbi:dTDP-4-dehydrorhamnose reductase [Actibacterium sp. 188UL27-1]|uniref:dTDP-4-dehydrorhamnose reductase n=1 Tax=Actibacterium sp. 188UL27-1 TaxID=2786961 RepID=UPI0019586F1F|nr:dTDP-4-dehydrorhamnose reductase [Actibacterium sp. 188UL27-1]
MKTVVFGKSGQVATELQRRGEVTALGRTDVDLADPDDIRRAAETLDADVFINAAAYTAVDKAEEEEARALSINGVAVRLLAETAKRRDIPLIHVSTDYVFDGSGERPRAPDAETGPLGAYGRTKLVGEDAIRAVDGDYAILRTSWVFSAHGGNFVKTMRRLGAERDSLNIVADQIGGPTSAAAIADALLAMAVKFHAETAPSGTYHFAGTPDVSWADFAREIFAQSDIDCTVTDIPTSAYPTPAQRPANSRLDCTTLSREYGIERPDWRADLADVLKELNTQ